MEPELIKREPLGNDFYIYVSGRHTFGTDAVLLAHFAGARRNDRLVDLGTGCGIIPMLMLRDGKLKSAVGVEISGEACGLAERTSREQNISNFEIIHGDLKKLKGRVDFGCHTLVTCNPPYKAPGAGLQNADETVRAARHETTCTLEDIICVSAKLLQTAGRFCICHRCERLAELMELMRRYKLEPKRMRLVCQRAGLEPWLVLVEGKKCAKTGMRIEPPLYIEENNQLSAEMLKIYAAYKEAYI